MPIPNCRSSIVGGYLDTAHELYRTEPDVQRAIAEARAEIDGEPEPELEEQRRETLAMWATHRWAATCLELAGFERTARLMRETATAEEAATLLERPDVGAPPAPIGQARTMDDEAGLAVERAAGAAMMVFPCTGPAMAAMAACGATRRAKSAGTRASALDPAEEIVNAARAAMDLQNPPDTC